MDNISLQIILVIIVTAVVISVVDNISDLMRFDINERHRELLFNETSDEHKNSTRTIYDTLTSGVNRQDEIIAKLDAILNNTNTNTSTSRME